MLGLSLVAASGGHSSSRCAGLSLSWPLLLRSTGSRCTGARNCGSRAQSLRGTWDPPRPGLEPMSPALAGRLSTTAPPGKPWWLHFIQNLDSRVLYRLTPRPPCGLTWKIKKKPKPKISQVLCGHHPPTLSPCLPDTEVTLESRVIHAIVHGSSVPD